MDRDFEFNDCAAARARPGALMRCLPDAAGSSGLLSDAHAAYVQLNPLRPTDLGRPIYVLRSTCAAHWGRGKERSREGVEGPLVVGVGER
jgi:hypothetical protein